MNKQELLKKVEKGILLSDNEELAIFNYPPNDAKEILLEYMWYTHFTPDVQWKIFDLPVDIAKKIWRRYLRLHTYVDAIAEMKAKELGWM